MKNNLHSEISKILEDQWLVKDKQVDALLALIKKHERGLVERVLDYVEHERDCILNGYSAGRPTKDGGYEVKLGGKWYQSRPVDKTPKCNCGLSDILAKLKDPNGPKEVEK